MPINKHLTRILLLMAVVGLGLCWKARHASILFADGLRYVDQARQVESGQLSRAMFGAIDHPAYPLMVAAGHSILGGASPESWQRAAQAASVFSAILLVVPLYLIALEMFGASTAWLAVVLSFLVPLSSEVMADGLSESTFLLFFMTGVWTSIRFLREGRFAWLPATIALAALAYWVRPEGLLLPAAMVATLGLIPLARSTRLDWPRWWAAVGFLVIGPTLLIAPIVATKGGLSTKPAVGRVLGLSGHSASSAVERTRVLKDGQTEAQTYVLAVRAMALAVRDAVTIPLLPLCLLGFVMAWPPGERGRPWVFLAVVMLAWAAAMVRLHATGGYCTPRHAMILAYLMIASAAFGLQRLLTMIAIPARWIGQGEGTLRAGPLVWMIALAALAISYRADLLRPINDEYVGYRGAASYLSSEVPKGDKVADVTGWALFYGQRPGYTFANLIEAMGDRSLTRVVVREAHLKGKWEYCDRLRQLVGDRKPVASFPENPSAGQSVVFVYDWSKPAKVANRPAEAPRR